MQRDSSNAFGEQLLLDTTHQVLPQSSSLLPGMHRHLSDFRRRR